MPVGGALAAAGIGGALIGASSAKKAANTQADAAREAAQYQLQAAREAAALQLGMFNTIRGDLSGYRDTGAAASSGYRALLGLPEPTGGGGGGGSNAPLTMESLTGSTVPIPKAGDANWSALLTSRPDVLAAYQSEASRDAKSKAYLEQLGINDAEGYAKWWAGQNNVQAPQWTQEQISAAFPQAANSNGPAAGPAAPALDGAGIQKYLESLPGYQFTRDQGIRSVTNALTTKGLGGISGPMAKGIARFVTGLADQTYGEQLSRMKGAVDSGQNAAAQTGAYGTSAASGASGALVGGANAVGAGITGAANANAAGTIGAANAISGGLNNAANAYLSSRVLGMYAPRTGTGG